MILLPEEERKEMGKRARQKIIKEYDKQIVIQAYLRAIKEASNWKNQIAYSKKKIKKFIPARFIDLYVKKIPPKNYFSNYFSS